MSLYEQYDLLEAFSSGQTGTVRARDRSSGAEVLVHFLTRDREAERVKEQVGNLASPARDHVLEIGEHGVMSFFVTTTDVPRLEEWLRSTRDPVRAGAWKLPAVAKNGAPGEFTQMFQAPVPVATQEIPLPTVAPAGSAQPAPAVTTDWGATQEIPLPPIAPAASAQVAPRPKSDPGEFTRVFQAAAGLSPSASVPPAAATGAGEFTRMFQAAPQSASLEAMASSTTQKFVPRQPAPPAVRNQGEFTRMFQAPASPAPVSAPPAPSAAPAATRSAMSPGATGAFGGMGVVQPAERGTGPSEFTRMIAVPSPQSSAAAVLPGTPSAPAQSLPVEPPKKSTNIAVLVAIFEGVVILALVLILFFALKK